MDKAEAVRCVKKYADIVRQNFNVRKIILYGSYLRETAQKDSDIDVAVVLNQVDEDFLMAEARLFRLRRDINARIAPVLLEESNDKSGFLEEVLKTGALFMMLRRQVEDAFY